MRINKRPDYERTIRRSMQRDFNKIPQERNIHNDIQEQPYSNKQYRISAINTSCQYAKYARYLVNKLVRCVESKGDGCTTGWYEFCFDDDRLKLNSAAQWSDNKKRYYLERPKLK